MKKIVSLLLALLMMGSLVSGALAVNEDVEGELVIYSSMYPFVIDMMDEAIKKEFPNLTPGDDGSFFLLRRRQPQMHLSRRRHDTAPLRRHDCER